MAAKWGRIDVLVNNAAVFIFGTIDEVTSEQWDKVLSVNIKVQIIRCLGLQFGFEKNYRIL